MTFSGADIPFAQAGREPVTPDGWERVHGPVPSSAVVALRDGRRRLLNGCVTVGNRVRAAWQRYSYRLGTGTVVAFEREINTGWIKVVVDYDCPPDPTMGEDGFARWDYDRTCLAHPAIWDGETQEESVARWRESIARRRQQAASHALNP